jgi:hypothetical protein
MAARISYRTFSLWHAIGSKYIAIACGGSIYALVLIAGLGLRVSIASMVGTTHMNLANMLRSPAKSKLFHLFGPGMMITYLQCRFPSTKADYGVHSTDDCTYATSGPPQHDVDVPSGTN